MSGLLRSICGVMAGGSRAALTQHFTDPKVGSIADVNAKDQSQETVISLMGMLAGSVLVKVVQGEGIEMWLTVIFLLSIHLFTNYRAVSSVIIRTLNRQRTNIVFSDIVNSLNEFDETMLANEQSGKAAALSFDSLESSNRSLSHLVITPKRASFQERILEPDGLLRWYSSSRTTSSSKRNDEVIGRARFTGFESIISILPGSVTLQELLAVCHSDVSGYVLYYSLNRETRLPTINICVFKNRQKDTDIRAWCHALILSRYLTHPNPSNPITAPLQPIYDTYSTVAHIFDKLQIESALTLAGWDLDRYTIQSKPIPTIVLADNVVS